MIGAASTSTACALAAAVACDAPRRYGFSRGVLSSLIRRMLAATEREVMMAGGKAIEIVRVRIA
jgi:hypothetical protein